MFNQPKNIFGEPKEMFTGQTLPKPAVHYRETVEKQKPLKRRLGKKL